MTQRRLRIEVVILVTIFLLGVCARLASATTPRPVDLAAAVNYQHWLATGNWLAGEYALDVYAQDVAQHLADTAELHHSDVESLLGCRWVAAGENIGVGPDIPSIVTAWMNSPSHLANITADYTHLGVGLVEKSGTLWVVTVFAK